MSSQSEIEKNRRPKEAKKHGKRKARKRDIADYQVFEPRAMLCSLHEAIMLSNEPVASNQDDRDRIVFHSDAARPGDIIVTNTGDPEPEDRDPNACVRQTKVPDGVGIDARMPIILNYPLPYIEQTLQVDGQARNAGQLDLGLRVRVYGGDMVQDPLHPERDLNGFVFADQTTSAASQRNRISSINAYGFKRDAIVLLTDNVEVAGNYLGTSHTAQLDITQHGLIVNVNPFGSLNMNVAADDALQGEGYLMYSSTPVTQRFQSIDTGNTSHFVAVRHDATFGWQYTSKDGDGWMDFEEQPGDRLVAHIDFTDDLVESLQGSVDTFQGIERGYIEGDLTYRANRWSGTADSGEFQIQGTYFVDGDEIINTSNTFNGLRIGGLYDNDGTTLVASDGNRVGMVNYFGVSAYHANVISNNLRSGIQIDRGTANFIDSNFIGTNRPLYREIIHPITQARESYYESTDLGNRLHGVLVEETAGTFHVGVEPPEFGDTNCQTSGGTGLGSDADTYYRICSSNIISANDRNGIFVQGSSSTSKDGSEIKNSVFGMDATQTYTTLLDDDAPHAIISELGNGQNGILITSASGIEIQDNLISGNYFNGIHSLYASADIDSSHNLIGTDSEGDSITGWFHESTGNHRNGLAVGPSASATGHDIHNNVISGNHQNGMWINAAFKSDANYRIYSNIVGLDIDGQLPLGNGLNGLLISGSGVVGGDLVIGEKMPSFPDPSIGPNVFSANDRSGIQINSSVKGVAVIRSYAGVGVDVVSEDGVRIVRDVPITGQGLGNGRDGILVFGRSNTIGLPDDGNTNHQNVIAENVQHGVNIRSTRIADSGIENDVIWNRIGHNGINGFEGHGIAVQAGTSSNILRFNKVEANAASGISVRRSDDNRMIGNDISSNGYYGIVVGQSDDNQIIMGNHVVDNARSGVALTDTERTIVRDNVIGDVATDSGGNEILLGNGHSGVQLIRSTDASIINNSITENARHGIYIRDAESVHNLLEENDIALSDNLQYIGIDLFEEGITSNDAGDVDEGANDKQNFPEFDEGTFVVGTGGTVNVTGILDSHAGDYRLEFFVNGDGRQHGEFVDSCTMLSNGTGSCGTVFGEFDVTISVPASGAGDYLVATATRLDDAHPYTSEFSQSVELINDNGGNPGDGFGERSIPHFALPKFSGEGIGRSTAAALEMMTREELTKPTSFSFQLKETDLVDLFPERLGQQNSRTRFENVDGTFAKEFGEMLGPIDLALLK